MAMTENYVPPPPDDKNDARRSGDPESGRGGLTISPKTVIDLAKMYTSYRPIIHWAAKLAHQKIPKELDEAMKVVAATGDPDALRRLQEEEDQGPTQGTTMQRGADGTYEVPPDTPGAPVMTQDMAEEAYHLYTEKRYGLMQIAQFFTERGSPVSKATVARYIDDVRQQYIEEEEEEKKAFKRRIALGALTAAGWFGSALGLHVLLNFLHLL